jgi:hypothetical protein
MDWYWWLLIAVAVILIGFLKVKVGGAYLQRLQQRRALEQQRLEEDF